MKRFKATKVMILSALAAIMFFSIGVFTKEVYASQITIVVPHTTPSSENNEKIQQTPKKEVFPVSVTESYDEHGRSTIIRRYELSRLENPQSIPREDFVFGNKSYTLTDIIKASNQNIEIKSVTEKVEKSSPTNNLEQVIALLDREISYDDGQFTGFLSLEVDSIKIEVAGRKTSSKTVTVTRDYPNLSNQDTSLIPKTVTQNSVNYTLTDINWVSGNTSAVDYTPIGDYYTAKATYSANVSGTSITGYTVMANYSGEVGFTNSDITIYDAVFMELRHPAQIVTTTPTTKLNSILDSFIDLNQSPQTEWDGQSDVNEPTALENQISAETQDTPAEQENQNNMPIIQEVTYEEMIAILSAEVSGAEAEIKTDTDFFQEQDKSILLIFTIGLLFVLVLLLWRIVNLKKNRKIKGNSDDFL